MREFFTEKFVAFPFAVVLGIVGTLACLAKGVSDLRNRYGR
jgi:hypothetical protein